jgi:BCCT family betaine/carnitine transporter
LEETRKRGMIDPKIFWPALIIVAAVSIPSALNPEAAGEAVNVIMAWTTGQLGWWFLVFGLFCLLCCGWLAFGRYGTVVMGKPGANEKPEFSYYSYIAMLFCAGMGISLLYWSIIEPIYYMTGPPFGLEVGSKEAIEWAAAYGPFHWGLIPWAFFGITSVPIAYNYYVRKNPRLRMSTASESVLGKYTDRWPGKAIDACVMFGLIGGVGTSLGLATPMISAFAATLFGVEETMGLKVIIIIIWTALFSLSVWRGLKKGIKLLSDINIILAIGLAVFILIFGPTSFIFNSFVNGLGLQATNFVRMSLFTDFASGSGWPQGWTVFFWAWWIAYAPFMGLFVARISRGRTIREIVIGNVLFGSLGCYVYFAILGGFSIYTELHGKVPVTQLMEEVGGNMTIVHVVQSLPFAIVVLPVFIILQFIFASTTLDSSAYVLASVCTKELTADEEPAVWNRLFWAFVLGGVSLVLMLIGGLKPLQTASIVVGLPLTVLMLILLVAFLKDIKKDYGRGNAPKSPEPLESQAE